MRITTQMINNTAKKTGIPVMQTSLLDYINKKEDTADTLLDAVQSGQSQAVSTANRTKYEKLEKAAEELTAQAEKLADNSTEGIWQKAKASGDTSDICGVAEKLADKYNSLLSALEKSTDALDVFYRKSLKELAEQNSGELSAIGISVEDDGSLSVDSQKLLAASYEDLEKVFGADSEFTQHLSYVSGRIGNNATANLESMTSSYLANGTLTGSYTSKYDFLG